MAHVLNKNKAPDLGTLAGRLAHCVEKAGGKRKLAASAILSEAQLFRYLHGLSDIPSERLITIAHAAHVDAGWLLTGTEAGSVIAAPQAAAQRPPFRPALMQYVARMLDEFLVEYQRSFSPRVKSQLLTLIYEALRHEEVLNATESFPNKMQMLYILAYVEALKSEEEIILYHRAMEILEYEQANLAEHHQLLSAFCNLVTHGYEKAYDSYVGTAYYERVGLEPLKGDEKHINEWLELAFKKKGRTDLTLLDIGCGNGRYLNYFHKTYPKLQLAGVDIAQQAMELSRKLENKGILPANTVEKANYDDLPYASGSMDLIYSRHTLHYSPYLPGTGLGLDKAMQEIYRVLANDGLALLVMPAGRGRTYTCFMEMGSPEKVTQAAEANGLKVVSYDIYDYNPSNTDNSVRALSASLQNSISIILEKKKTQ